MAEELAEFLLKKGIKANYMHSETKTLERIEIISEKRAMIQWKEEKNPDVL